MFEKANIKVQRAAGPKLQRSAPQQPPPVVDDSELIALRKQVATLTTKCGELEMATMKLSDMNQLLTEEKNDQVGTG